MFLKYLSKNKNLFILFSIFLIFPNLFNKLNLIDNHEIYSNLNRFNNYFNFIKGHPEIFTNFNTSTFRPFFYTYKGLEFFLFKDNSFFYFLIRSFLFVLISINFYKITNYFLKSNINKFFLPLFVCANPYSHDIFFRAGPQEIFGLTLISFILLILTKDYFEFFLKRKDKYILYFALISLGLVKEPFVFLSFFFIFYIYFFSKNLAFNKVNILIFFISLINFILILSHYKLNGHTYGDENNYSILKSIELLFNLFKISKVHFIFFLLQSIVILINFKKLNKKYLILLFFLNLFYFYNFIVTNGWVIHRYFMINIICIFFLLLCIFYFCEKRKKKFFFILNYSLIFLIIVSLVTYSIRTSRIIIKNNIFHDKIYVELKNYDLFKIDKNFYSNYESYMSLIIFLKNIYPKKKIVINKNNENNLYEIKKINYDNIYTIRFLTKKISLTKEPKIACLYFKQLESSDNCKGDKIIIN